MSEQPAPRPPLSIVVVTRDRPTMLARALAALREAMAPADELIVVDSASTAIDEVRAVAERYDAHLVRMARPGETVARNAGWRASTHDLIAYTDDDVWVDVGWAEAMARCCADHPEAAFVTGRIDIPPGQGTLAVSIKDEAEPDVFDRSSAQLVGHAASLTVRRDALAAIDGFDELLGAGARFHAGPEIDVFDRLFAAGRTGRYEPSARAWHDQWRGAREYVALQHRYGIGIGARMSKLARSDRTRLRLVVGVDVWRWGIAPLPRVLADRDWFRAAGSVVRIVGMVQGFVLGALVPLRDGHFVTPESR